MSSVRFNMIFTSQNPTVYGRIPRLTSKPPQNTITKTTPKVTPKVAPKVAPKIQLNTSMVQRVHTAKPGCNSCGR